MPRVAALLGGEPREAEAFSRRGAAGVAVAYLVVIAFLASTVALLPLDGDFGLHASVIGELARHPWHPADPLTGAPTHSPYFTPYTVALGLLARASGASGLDMLHVAAAVNAVLLLTGLVHLVRRFSDSPWAPPLAFASLTLLQGSVLNWSGFVGLTSLSIGLSYPSTFALGLTLHLWALVHRAARQPWPWWGYLLLGLLAAEITLDHQFTALGAALGCLAMIAPVWRKLGRRRLLLAAAAVAVVVVVAVVWPYYSLFSLAKTSTSLDAIQHPLYVHMFYRYGPGLLLGFLALLARFSRRSSDPLVVLFVLALLVVAYGDVTHHWAWGRAWPFVMLAGLLAFSVELPKLLGAVHGPLRLCCLVVLAAMLGAGLWTQRTGVRNALPISTPRGHRPGTPWPGLGWVADRVPAGDVVLTGEHRPLCQLPAYGMRTVQPAYPEPWLASEAARDKAAHTLLAPGTRPRARAALLRRYRVSYLVSSKSPAQLGWSGFQLVEIAHSRAGERLYTIHAVAGNGSR